VGNHVAHSGNYQSNNLTVAEKLLPEMNRRLMRITSENETVSYLLLPLLTLATVLGIRALFAKLLLLLWLLSPYIFQHTQTYD
jgi:hypothetical protein